MKLEHHPISKIFPMMKEEQYSIFRDGMKKFGYDSMKPIVTLDGMILDGRIRNKAGCELGFEVPRIPFNSHLTPLEFVIRENLNRRHLSVGQIGAISLEIYDSLREQFMSKKKSGVPTEFKGACNENRAVYVAKIFGIGKTAVNQCLLLRRHAPELLRQVKVGEFSISEAIKRMPKIRHSQRHEIHENEARKVTKQFDPIFTTPLVYDSYEKFMGDHRKALNDAGYNAQIVFCARKVYVQIVKMGESFRPWGNARSEHDFRLAFVGAFKELKIK